MLLVACGRGGSDMKAVLELYNIDAYAPEYATGFEIRQTAAPESASRLFVTKSPWQGANGCNTYMLMSADGEEVPSGFEGQVLKGPARRIVCMSSSHVAMLDAIGEADRIIGISGKNYIATPSVVSRIDGIAEVGYEGNIDYERLIAAKPDLVMIYGVGGASTMEPRLKELGIPFIYIGDYTEQSPLGKAEWMRLIAALVGKEIDEEHDRFSEIARSYNQIKQTATPGVRPKVMLNIPYGDVWYMPGPDNYMVRLIEDAGGEYIFKDGVGSESLPIDFETAYQIVNECDIWLNVGQVNSIDELVATVPKLKDAPVVRNRMVFNNNRLTTPGGGNAFWENGAVNPHVILADLASMFTTKAGTGDSLPTYYKRLE